MNRRNILGLEHLTLLATFTPECQGRGRGVLVSCRVPMAVQTPWGLAQSSQKSPGLAEAADNDQAGALGLSGASQSGLRSCLRFAWLVATPTAPTPPYPIAHIPSLLGIPGALSESPVGAGPPWRSQWCSGRPSPGARTTQGDPRDSPGIRMLQVTVRDCVRFPPTWVSDLLVP